MTGFMMEAGEQMQFTATTPPAHAHLPLRTSTMMQCGHDVDTTGEAVAGGGGPDGQGTSDPGAARRAGEQ